MAARAALGARPRAGGAEALELDPGFIMSRAQLEEVGRARPRSAAELAALPGVRNWQVEAIGDALAKAMR